jgi:hypothetical protein
MARAHPILRSSNANIFLLTFHSDVASNGTELLDSHHVLDCGTRVYSGVQDTTPRHTKTGDAGFNMSCRVAGLLQ